MTTPLPDRLTLPADFTLTAGPLVGHRILITGASRGLGRAIALACALAGAQTLLLARDVRALEAVADAIAAQNGLEPVLIPFNLEGATVTDYEDLGDLLQTQFGQLEGLVLNAGMLGELSPMANYDPVIWARVFQVNVHSNFLLAKTCLPLLNAAARASLLLVSSAVGRRGRAYWGAYAASKFAVEGMMQVLADELADTSAIRVNSVNPGRCRTRMRAQAYPAEDATRLPLPEDLAPAFAYLLSPAASGFHARQLDLQ